MSLPTRTCPSPCRLPRNRGAAPGRPLPLPRTSDQPGPRLKSHPARRNPPRDAGASGRVRGSDGRLASLYLLGLQCRQRDAGSTENLTCQATTFPFSRVAPWSTCWFALSETRAAVCRRRAISTPGLVTQPLTAPYFRSTASLLLTGQPFIPPVAWVSTPRSIMLRSLYY